MSQYILSPKAREDLIEIHDYIAKDNPTAALEYIDLLEEKCKFLASSPMIGIARPQFGTTVRSFPVGSYIIFYDPKENGVEIIHVLHAKRDILSIFKKER